MNTTTRIVITLAVVAVAALAFVARPNKSPKPVAAGGMPAQTARRMTVVTIYALPRRCFIWPRKDTG